MVEKKWGGVRPGAGRPFSDYMEGITLEVTPLMNQYIEREVHRRERPRNEVLRYLLGKQLGIEQNMQRNNEKGVYEGTTIEGRIVVVDSNTFAEALQQAEKEGMDRQEIYSTAMWEELIGTNDGVWYCEQQGTTIEGRIVVVDSNTFAEALQQAEKEGEAMIQDDSDTVVVPAYEARIQKIALEENRWYSIRIGTAMRSRIKHIAFYQTAPQSAITYVAEVRSIEPWPKDPGKFVVNFAEPATKIDPIRLVKKSKGQLRGLRYANYERLIHEKFLNDVFGN
jgi:hypothetical protein